MSVKLCRNNQTSSTRLAHQSKIQLKALIAIVDKTPNFVNKSMVLKLPFPPSHCLAHCPLFAASFSLTEDVLLFPHKYPEFCSDVARIWFRCKAECTLGSTFLPVATVCKGCVSQFLLSQVTHDLPACNGRCCASTCNSFTLAFSAFSSCRVGTERKRSLDVLSTEREEGQVFAPRLDVWS